MDKVGSLLVFVEFAGESYPALGSQSTIGNNPFSLPQRSGASGSLGVVCKIEKNRGLSPRLLPVISAGHLDPFGAGPMAIARS
jgi:hypothetical protein